MLHVCTAGGNTQASEKWRKELLPEFCTATVEVLDPDSEIWSPGPTLPNALCGAGIVKYGGTVLVVGGEDDKSWMAGECWLREKDQEGQESWQEGREFPSVMSTFGCLVASVNKDLLKSAISQLPTAVNQSGQSLMA